MAGERRGGRERGKSDRIDAIAVARAALREGLERLRSRSRPASSSRSGCWSITANVWFACAPPSITTCSGICTTCGPSSAPRCALLSKKWTARVGRRLARAEQTARVGIARDELGHLRELSRTIDALEAEIAELVAQVAPQLLSEPGVGAVDRRQADQRDRRRSALCQRRQARPRRRHRADPR